MRMRGSLGEVLTEGRNFVVAGWPMTRILGLKRIVRIFANNRILLNGTNIFRGSNSRWQRFSHFSAISTETLHSRTLPRARWPPDHLTRSRSTKWLESTNTTWQLISLACPSESSAVSTFLTYQRKGATTHQDLWMSGALSENATASPGFCCKLRLQTSVSLEVEFSLFYTASLVIPRISKALR